MTETTQNYIEIFKQKIKDVTPVIPETFIHFGDLLHSQSDLVNPIISKLEKFYTNNRPDKIDRITNWATKWIDPYGDHPNPIIRGRQFRAVRLLLLNQDVLMDPEQADWRGNPLTDIMFLLAGTARDIPSHIRSIGPSQESPLKYHFSHQHLYPAIFRDPPSKSGFFHKPKDETEYYPLQYAEIGTEAVRIIRGHEKFPTITDRAINTLNFAASTNPPALDAAFTEFHLSNEIKENVEIPTAKISVALLEILNNIGRLQDPHVQPLVNYLVRKAILNFPHNDITQALKYYSISHVIDWEKEKDQVFAESRISHLPIPASSAWENQTRTYHSAQQKLEELSSPHELLMYKIRNGRIPPNINDLRNTLHSQISRTEKDLPRGWSAKWIRLLEISNQGPLPQNFLVNLTDGEIPEVGLKILNRARNYYLTTSDRPNAKISSIPLDSTAVTPEVIGCLSKNPLVFLASKWEDTGFRIALCNLISKDPKSFDIFLKISSADLLDSAYHPRNISDYLFSDPRQPLNPDQIFTFLSQLSGLVPNQASTLTQPESLNLTGKLTEYLSLVPDSLPVSFPHRSSLKSIAAKIAGLKPLNTPGYTKVLGLEFPRGIEYKLEPIKINKEKVLFYAKYALAGTSLGVGIGVLGKTPIPWLDEKIYEMLAPEVSPPNNPKELMGSEYQLNLPDKEISKPQPILFANAVNPPDNQTAGLLSHSFWPLNPTQPQYSANNFYRTDPDRFQTVEEFKSPSTPLPDQPSFVIKYATAADTQLPIISPPDNFSLEKSQVKLTYQQNQTLSTDYFLNPMGQLVSEQLLQNYETLITLSQSSESGNYAGKRITNMEAPYSLYSGMIFEGSPQEYSEKINSSLSADPQLQQLHKSFISALQVPSDNRTQSEIIIKYLDFLQKFIDKNHYYGLSTPNEIDGRTPASALELLSLIRNRSGFDCKIAAQITSEWLLSAGIDSDQQHGFKPIVKDKSLWMGWGHVRNIAHLPDGSSYIIDNTPPSKPGLTPAEDLETLQPPEITVWDEIKADAKQLSIKNILGLGTAFTAALVVYCLRPGRTSQSEAAEIIRTAFLPEKTENNQPPLDESEIKLLSDVMLYLSAVPQDSLYQNAEILFQSLAHFPVPSSEPRMELIEFLTGDDRSFPAFMEPNPDKAFDIMAVTYGPEIAHPSMPPQISSALALREAQIAGETNPSAALPSPKPPPEFLDIYNLVGATLISDSEQTRQRILAHLFTAEKQAPHIQASQNRRRLNVISRVLSHYLESSPPDTRNQFYLNTLLRLCEDL